jgi:polyisoprenoid-binding protein YceI
MKTALTLGLCIACSSAWAQNWQPVPAASALEFEYQAMGSALKGSFPKYRAQIAFDPQSPQQARVDFSIDTLAIDAGLAEATTEAPSAAFFDSRKYREARFVSQHVKALGGQRYEVAGTLSLKGKSRPLKFVASVTPQGSALLMRGGFTVNRLDYGIGSGDWADTSALGNAVHVKFNLKLAPLD